MFKGTQKEGYRIRIEQGFDCDTFLTLMFLYQEKQINLFSLRPQN